MSERSAINNTLSLLEHMLDAEGAQIIRQHLNHTARTSSECHIVIDPPRGMIVSYAQVNEFQCLATPEQLDHISTTIRQIAECTPRHGLGMTATIIKRHFRVQAINLRIQTG